MLRISLTILLLCSLGFYSGPVSWGAERPNVLLVLVDDLGFSDIGPYGSEIDTPHLDALAADGLRFTQFYNTARCWPTRAALMTGYYAQQVRRDTVAGVKSGSQGIRPEWAPLVPQLLKQAGYRCYHSGKWHIDSTPLATGFDRSYWLQDSGRYFSPKVHYEDDQPLPAVPPGSNYYSTTAITDHVLKTLQTHQQQYADQPFFHYLTYLAPHFPLHARPEDIAKYQDRYLGGWNELRAARAQKQQALGLLPGVATSEFELEIGPPYDFPEDLKTLGPQELNRPLPWTTLTADQQAFQAAKMAVHAAMVDRIDQELGRIVQLLKETGKYDNTLIMFLSDNGASAEIMVRDDGHDPQAPAGSAASHLCLGPGWSTACNTPFRRHKTWNHEGGIATPFVVSWPAGIAARGELRHVPAHVIDVVPTLLELAGIQPDRHPEAPPLPGHSMVPNFAADHAREHAELWWQHEGNRAFRAGRWKIVAAGKSAPWELYDLEVDRSEMHNVAEQHPQIVASLVARWETQWKAYSQNAQP